MAAATAAQNPAWVDAPPAPRAPGPVPVRIPGPRRPLDDAQWPLEHRPGAAGEARRAALDGWGVDASVAEGVVLVVCELVTNAVEHSRAPLALHLHREPAVVWVDVSDGGPVDRGGAWVASCAPEEHGGGVAIVEALATGRGCRDRVGGSTLWARLAAA